MVFAMVAASKVPPIAWAVINRKEVYWLWAASVYLQQ